MIDGRGSFRTDQIVWAKSGTAKPGEVARARERKPLIHAGQVHTETGAHAKLLKSWEAWAKRVSFKVGTIGTDEAQRKMKERVRKLNEQFEAKARLPWL